VFLSCELDVFEDGQGGGDDAVVAAVGVEPERRLAVGVGEAQAGPVL
jgi:hypothetical protein